VKTTPGIGDILALTIMLETGEIRRFPAAFMVLVIEAPLG